MSTVIALLINIILIFIVYLILNHRINENSVPSLLEKYTKEVDNLIIELNRAVDDVVNISEEKIEELKKIIKNVESLLNNKSVKKILSGSRVKKNLSTVKELGVPYKNTRKENFLEKTKHLLSMGYSKEEIARILNINRAEVEFLESLNR